MYITRKKQHITEIIAVVKAVKATFSSDMLLHGVYTVYVHTEMPVRKAVNNSVELRVSSVFSRTLQFA